MLNQHNKVVWKQITLVINYIIIVEKEREKKYNKEISVMYLLTYYDNCSYEIY